MSIEQRVLIFLLLSVLTACGDVSVGGVGASVVPKSGETLHVVTRMGGTTYFEGRDQVPVGPEVFLINSLAKAQDWKVVWVIENSTAQVLETLEQGKAHIAAAGLTFTEARDDKFTRGASHLKVTEQVICPQKLENTPKKLEDLAIINLVVAARTSYVDTLESLKQKIPGLTFEQSEEESTEMLLARAGEDKICVVSDSNIADKSRRLFPELRVTMTLPGKSQLGWYLPKDANKLAQLTKSWIQSSEGKVAVNLMHQRYYAYLNNFDFVDLRALSRSIDERLPKYKKYFLEAEEKTGIPADLLAALSYQESHWNPKAVSPTGVRGIMMLTRNTAKSLGVDDRHNPKMAILAGADYLRDRYDRLPDSIPIEDRWFQAMASYNIGRAHVLDVRLLARRMGKNPDSWQEIKALLPLKSNKKYYSKMKHGYARGHEPVLYVQRIRNYRDVIRQSFNEG
ncbi:MAG: membrane-bound lytic murein transglycosylase F [Cellvibrionaceae bacterium]|jgi:membrane-bound lytic murein transglycosylase F